MNFLR